ncbi:hypothetical protein M885DRAFT_618018 [Pelagophyceae sp. CCMP2097]|nr:hypothetical protein M885DRAFT_618018 [Pelagophyceae sp. CCMP2097]
MDAFAGLWLRELLYEPRSTLADSAAAHGSRVLWAQAPCGLYVDVRHAANEAFVVRGFAGRCTATACAGPGAAATLLWQRHVDTQPSSCPGGVDSAPCRVVAADPRAVGAVLLEDGDGYLEVWRRLAAWDAARGDCAAAGDAGVDRPVNIRIVVDGVTFVSSAAAVSCYSSDFHHQSRTAAELAGGGVDEAEYQLANVYQGGYVGPGENPERAFKFCELAAKQGHARAQVQLASCLEHGSDVPVDSAAAARWYRIAAEQGHPGAQFNLGLFYTDGNGVLQSFCEAVRWYHAAAAQNDADDFRAAEQFFKRAAALGRADAAVAVSQLAELRLRSSMRQITNVSKEELNERRAEYSAKDHGAMENPPVTCKPCCVCDEAGGQHCTKCKSRHYCGKKCQLIDWYERGHKAQCPQLSLEWQRRRLGALYLKKRRLENPIAAFFGAPGLYFWETDDRDEEDTVFLAKKEAALNLWPKASALKDATLAWRGTCPICLDQLPNDYSRRTFYECCCGSICVDCSAHTTNAEWVRRVKKHVDEGNAEAQLQLGFAYIKGLSGLEKNIVRGYKLFAPAAAAALWYRRAAEQGYHVAEYNLGRMLHDGKGVAQSHEEAVKWFRLAAEKGIINAFHDLGVCYANGQGVPRDLDEALRWFRRAAAQGHAEAAAAVERF